jgi:hypothetical protein
MTLVQSRHIVVAGNHRPAAVFRIPISAQPVLNGLFEQCARFVTGNRLDFICHKHSHD